MAIHASSTPVPLSPLFTDPLVRRAFERVERDDGSAAVIAFLPGPRRSGGSAAAMPGLLRSRHQPVSNRFAPNYPATSGVVDGAGLLRRDRQPVQKFALAVAGLPPAALPRLRETMSSMIEEMIDVLDMLDAAEEDLEPSLAGFYGSDDDREEEDEHGTEIDRGEADPSDYQPWNGVWRATVAL